jgi:hypothetical protein
MSPLLMMAEGGNASEAQIKAAFIEKLGREPEPEALRYYKTQSPEKLSSDIDSSSERAAILTRASTTQTSSSSGGGGGGGGGGGSSGAASANKSVLDSIKQIYLEQLGRPADPEGLEYYANQIATGKKTAARVAEELDRTTDGFNYDRQQISSAYRKNFGRNPDQAGIQYWMGQEDKHLYNQEQFANLFKGSAADVDAEAIRNNPEGFVKFASDALAADPYFGGFAVDNPYIYDEATAKLRPNVSRTAAGQYVQFVDPITQRPAYSGYTPDGQFKVFAGNDVLQPDRIRQAVNLATISGSLSKADADRILNAVSSPEKFRELTGNGDPNANTLYALLSEPKATVVLDALGVQIGEDADASLAMSESAARQRIVDRAREQTGQNINPATLLQADVAREMGVKFPFTKDNLTLDPLTGKPIRTMMTAEDVANNIFTYLNIPTDKELKNIILTPPGGTAPGGGTPTTPAAVTGTTGDFRGLAFPEARPTTISETPAMLNFAPYTLTQPGSGQQKTTEPQPVIPKVDTRVDPTTGTLLGAVIGSLMPTPSGGGVIQGVTDIVDAVSGAVRPKNILNDVNVDAGITEIPSTYAKNGGLATPLMKEGGMVPHFADGGVNQVAQGLDKIISAPSARGALIGALMTHLMNAQAQSQAANAYRGIDMSKVGVIPPRTTQIGPVRFAPYRQYASAPEIPQSISSPINIGALRASQTPMTSFTSTANMVNPLERFSSSRSALPMGISPLLGGINPNFQPSSDVDLDKIRQGILATPPGIMDDDFVPRTPQNDMPMGQRLQNIFGALGRPMADGGAAYYTYGQHIDPLEYLEGMARGGMAHGGLNEVHHADNAPLVQGRKDYRAGSAVTGPGDGQSDDIPAMLADGEYVFDADTVAQLGNGSTKAGSKILDRFREELRAHKRSAPVNKIPPPSKSPLAYLAEAQKKMKGARRG